MIVLIGGGLDKLNRQGQAEVEKFFKKLKHLTILGVPVVEAIGAEKKKVTPVVENL